MDDEDEVDVNASSLGPKVKAGGCPFPPLLTMLCLSNGLLMAVWKSSVLTSLLDS